MIADLNHVPASYDEMYQFYFQGSNSLASKLIRSALPSTYDASDIREEMAQDAFLKMLEMDILSRFDPTKSNFGGMVFCAVRTVVGNYMSKRSRSALTGLNAGAIEETVTSEDGEVLDTGTFSLEREFGSCDVANRPEALDAKQKVNALYTAVAARARAPHNKRDENLLTVVCLLDDGYTTVEIAAALGVTNGTIHNWVRYLAQIVTTA